jgi:glycine/D-amino acid oxidase-like deaminating enzyme
VARYSSAIVVGAGIAGASTALSLRRRGIEVTLYDAWEPGHAAAASGGEHRILRACHGADEFYTRMVREARLRWLELAEESGRELFVECGSVILAHERNTTWEDAARETFAKLGVPHFVVDPSELALRLPVLDPRNLAYGLWEPESGFVYAKAGVETTVARFVDLGGRLERGHITTDRNERLMLDGTPLQADVIVVAAGAWMPGLYRRTLGPLLEIERQDVIMIAPPPGDDRYDHTRFPTWIDHGYPAYGIPAAGGFGFKAVITWHHLPIDLQRDDRVVHETAIARTRRYLAHRFPGLVDQPISQMAVGQICSTKDTHFIIDRHPDHPEVVLAGGDSGHLYKHGPVIGDHIAEVAIGVRPVEPRFAYGPHAPVALAHRPQ